MSRRLPRPAFTLVELLVVLAAVAVLIGLLMPAVQKARAAAARLACASQLRQLALALHHHHDAHDALPPAARADQPGCPTWFHELLPFVEQTGLGRALGEPGPWGADRAAARSAMPRIFLCPADRGPTLTEAALPTRSRGLANYRGCAGDGDPYGDVRGHGAARGLFALEPGQGLPGGPAPLRTRLGQVRDGTSSTLMLSEGLVAGSLPGWGGPTGDLQASLMGGSLFSSRDRPNSPAPDRLLGPCPAEAGDTAYREPCLTLFPPDAPTGAAGSTAAARSRHTGGVNAALADGSVHFVTNGISGKLWQALGTRAGGEPADESAGTPTGSASILFIGNSYTGGNDLPSAVQGLWSAVGAGSLDVEREVIGGYQLRQHDQGNAPAHIRARPWTYVVLQEQSQTPILFRSVMFRYGRLLDEDIRRNGARTVLYMTWCRSWAPETQHLLTDSYQTLGRDCGALVAPAGLAWENCRRLHPEIPLYEGDGSHPSPQGTYLTACVFVALLTGRPLDDAPAQAGQVSIPPEQARHLRRIAAAVADGWRP